MWYCSVTLTQRCTCRPTCFGSIHGLGWSGRLGSGGHRHQITTVGKVEAVELVRWGCEMGWRSTDTEKETKGSAAPSVYEVANKYVFKCRLKVDSDDDDVTNDGKLFHAEAAATGKARSPIVLRRVTGTTTAVDELERRLHLALTSAAYRTVIFISNAALQNCLQFGSGRVESIGYWVELG